VQVVVTDMAARKTTKSSVHLGHTVAQLVVLNS